MVSQGKYLKINMYSRKDTLYGSLLNLLHCFVRKLVKGNFGEADEEQGWVLQIVCSRRVGILCNSEVSLLHFIFVPSSLTEKHFPSLEDTPPSQDLEQVDHLDHSNHTASTSCRVRLSSVPCFFFFFYSNTMFGNIYSFVFKIVKRA